MNGGQFVLALMGLVSLTPSFAAQRHSSALFVIPKCSPDVSAQSSVSITVYGDSTTAGLTLKHGAYVITPKNAPAQLQAILKSDGYCAKVVNDGKSGSGTWNLIKGTGGFEKPWAQEMASSPASIVVINMGLNDAALINTGWDTVSVYEKTMNQLVQVGLSSGKEVFVETPNPRNDTVPDALMVRIAAADVAVVKENPDAHLIDERAAILALPNWKAHLSDGLHPDEALYTFKACVDAQALVSSLSKPCGRRFSPLGQGTQETVTRRRPLGSG